jgi:di/tripeptidase
MTTEPAEWDGLSERDEMTVEIKLIGDRPAGIVALDSPIVQATQRAVTVLTRAPRVTFAGSSTDSNLAMSQGIPAVTMGGGEGGNWHCATNGTGRLTLITARRTRC